MRVNHAQAERLLKEHGDAGVPGFETLEVDLGSPDDDGIADLVVKNNLHASVEAFANAAGILAAVPPYPEIKCLEAPKIIGLPNVGQFVTASAGVWEEPAESTAPPAVVPTGVVLRWLYDGNEEDPVVIPEGDPHGYGSGGGTDLHVPAAALGKSITLRVTRGATTVYSEPFGPIEGGLTEFTFPAEPVRDTDIVSAEPASRRRSGGVGTERRPQDEGTCADSVVRDEVEGPREGRVGRQGNLEDRRAEEGHGGEGEVVRQEGGGREDAEAGGREVERLAPLDQARPPRTKGT